MPQGKNCRMGAWAKGLGMNELSPADQAGGFHEMMGDVRFLRAVIDHDEGAS